MPEYTIKREDIMVMFKSLVSGTDQGTNQANQDDDNSVPAVKYYMEVMKKSGSTKREGSSQKGKWLML